MKGLLEKYLRSQCSNEEKRVLLNYFGFSDHEERFSKAILACLSVQDEYATLPIAERLHEQLKAGVWIKADDQLQNSESKLFKSIKSEYLLAGVLICLFLVLMFFLFKDKVQYDKMWKAGQPANTVSLMK